MAVDTEQIPGPQRRQRSATVEGVVTTLEWVLIAVVFAFIGRTFIMEAFRIPTGSMAETLRGAHYHLRCSRCGYKYDVDGDSIRAPRSRCPSCGYFVTQTTSVSNGDRIFVLKSLYHFKDPKRWDVVVFNYPGNPHQNYIKRMIAGPGETVELIDGDVYIDGRIARKPAGVQQEMWMPIYDNDYQPSDELGLQKVSEKRSDGNRRWQQPFENVGQSSWDLGADGGRIFTLESEPQQIHTIGYDSAVGNDFKATYAYNETSGHKIRPKCSDLMVQFYISADSSEGLTGVSLRKYETVYRGRVDFGGQMVIEKVVGGETVELKRQNTGSFESSKPVLFEFANVDHQLILKCGARELRHDLGRLKGDAGVFNDTAGDEVTIFGAGRVRVVHVKVYRDTYYLDRDMYYRGDKILRAGQDNAFTLGEDEFFVCGDNSNASFDSRFWVSDGVGNRGTKYRMGIVPRDYLVGKAFFIYWGDGFKFGNLPIIPNISKLGFIYGGSDEDI